MKQETTQLVQQLLQQPKNLVIVGHKNPDGDAIGSCLGLARYLKTGGHSVHVVMPNNFPRFLKWIPDCDQVVVCDHQHERCERLIRQADIIFTLDFNALDRTGSVEPLLRGASAQFVMIDHHQQPDNYAVATYSDVEMSSTSEMVFHFIKALGGTESIDAELATQLYVGIMTDTGSFRFASTSSTTHRVIAELIDKGARNAYIHQQVFDTNRPQRLKLLGKALDNLVHLPEYKTAYITLSQAELDACEFLKGDTEGFVNYALSLEGVIFAAIFIENSQEDIVKISLRSKGDFSVNQVARDHFEGGGHINAAGGRSTESLRQTVDRFTGLLAGFPELNAHE
jgi:phosphoesterase RecJ-like protein